MEAMNFFKARSAKDGSVKPGTVLNAGSFQHRQMDIGCALQDMISIAASAGAIVAGMDAETGTVTFRAQ